MYAVIYWVGDDEVYPCLTEDGQIKLFDKISEADDYADQIDNRQEDDGKKFEEKLDARVISIEAAKDY